MARWRKLISRDVLSVSLDQFPIGQLAPGVGDTAEPFSNIKTPVAAKNRRTATKLEISGTFVKNSIRTAKALKGTYRPRYLAHIGLVSVAALLVMGNSPDRAHSVSLRLMSSQSERH